MAILAPSIGTVGENATAATTLNVPYPSGLTPTSLLVLAVSTGSIALPTIPAGFTTVYNASNTGSTVSPALMVGIKQATGAESGNLAVTTPNSFGWGQLLAFTGVDLITPQDVAANTVDVTTAAVVHNMSLTTTRLGVVLVYADTGNSTTANSTPPTVPATFTETGDRTAGGTRAAAMGYLLWASSGATGTVANNWTVAVKGNACLLALRPARFPPLVYDTAQPRAATR